MTITLEKKSGYINVYADNALIAAGLSVESAKAVVNSLISKENKKQNKNNSFSNIEIVIA